MYIFLFKHIKIYFKIFIQILSLSKVKLRICYEQDSLVVLVRASCLVNTHFPLKRVFFLLSTTKILISFHFFSRDALLKFLIANL